MKMNFSIGKLLLVKYYLMIFLSEMKFTSENIDQEF
jgi:hypothetical protein